MADLGFKRKDVEGLARKVARLDLTDEERSLLVAIFELAGAHTECDPPGQVYDQPTGEDLKLQLLNAYMPDGQCNPGRYTATIKIRPGQPGGG